MVRRKRRNFRERYRIHTLQSETLVMSGHLDGQIGRHRSRRHRARRQLLPSDRRFHQRSKNTPVTLTKVTKLAQAQTGSPSNSPEIQPMPIPTSTLTVSSTIKLGFFADSSPHITGLLPEPEVLNHADEGQPRIASGKPM